MHAELRSSEHSLLSLCWVTTATCNLQGESAAALVTEELMSMSIIYDNFDIMTQLPLMLMLTCTALVAGREDVHVLVLLNGLLLCEAHVGDGRGAEHCAGDVLVVGLALRVAAKDVLGKGHSLRRQAIRCHGTPPSHGPWALQSLVTRLPPYSLSCQTPASEEQLEGLAGGVAFRAAPGTLMQPVQRCTPP